MDKGREVGCNVEIFSVEKDNFMTDYNMDNKTITNDRDHIISSISTPWGMMDV